MSERKEQPKQKQGEMVFTVGPSGNVIKARSCLPWEDPNKVGLKLQQEIVEDGLKPETPKLEG